MIEYGTDILNDESAAKVLGVQPRTVRLWRRTRGLPFLRLTGKVCLIRRSDLDGWLDQHRVAIAARGQEAA